MTNLLHPRIRFACILSIFLALSSFLTFFPALALDPPHNVANEYSCDSCHDVTSNNSNLFPEEITAGTTIDETIINKMCWSCHNPLGDAPDIEIRTHSSLTTDEGYGKWTVECWVCHSVHSQKQQGQDIDPADNEPYGMLIRTTIDRSDITYADTTPPKSGRKTVTFKGPGSFTDTDGIGSIEGVCQVCHTRTTHWTDSSAADVHYSGQNCMDCHSHTNGFAHGSGTGAGCIECHGHDAGTVYGEAPNSPYVPNAASAVSIGTGTFQSHSTHTEKDIDDLKGPGIYCDTCHDTGNFPYFNSGPDTNGDGRIDMSETDVCDSCHSPGGSYNGIDDSIIGAKTIWKTGAYAATNDSTLQADKQKWCAGCHDESASVISSVAAPNVIGDEDGTYIYGTGWGYYNTGHGLTAGETFPSKGGVETLSGRPVKCDSCHDYATAHIDGESRTFDDGDVFGLDSAIYRQGYRLKMIDGLEPYRMPRPSNIGNNSDQFRVCFQTGCHDSGPFTDSANMSTNLVTDGVNRHEYHLNFNNQELVAADWSGAYNSRMTCVNCHNVHGSTRLAMVRDGKLTGREPGQQIWYKNDAATYIKSGSSNPPIPEDLPLSASDGTAWIPNSSGNLCAFCHPINGQIATEDRLPFQDIAQAPFLQWVGTSDLTSDGVAPNSAAGNSIFTFRVAYSDINNDSPSPIEVWVDLNDNDSYEGGEKFTMTGTEALDTNMVDGKTYTKSLAIAQAGDGILNYRFYAYDGGLEATGEPTADSTVSILNNAPTLTWTGDIFYQTDGVNPNIGGNGDTFSFRTNFTDSDNETPATIQVWVDEDDNDSYAETEKYDLTAVEGGDTTTSDGKLYATSLSLAWTGDGDLKYRFYAADAINNATGTPTQDSVLTVQVGANSPPSLQYIAAGCTVDGVKPQIGAPGAEFVFTVNYTDSENDCPTSIEAWIDENDINGYEAGEKYSMTEVDAGDTICSDGKLYSTTQVLTLAGDNLLNYRFYATDGTDAAVGEATQDKIMTVVDALKVRPAGGAGWYSTIQAGIDAINGAHTVLVYEGTYNEDVLFEFGGNDSNTTLRSVCGPDTTIINGSGSGTVVTFSRYSKSQIDGFQVTGGTTGITVNGTQVTINNCQVHDNTNGLGGISVAQSGDMPTLILTNSEIYNNSSDRGAGIRISRGTLAPGHTISNSIIRNNTTVGDDGFDGGGGLYLSGAPNITISNSVIKDNNSNNHAGGGLYVTQVPDPDFGVGDGLVISDSIISGNTSDSWGGGIYSNLSTIKFVRSSITGNTSATMGGAIAHPSAGITTSFENCVVTDNLANQAGMAKMNGGTLDIINSTIANNRATDHSGAIYNQLATITIRNSILWGNQAATVGHIASFNGGSMTITDSIIQSGDDGNFTNAPFFSGNVTPTASGFAAESDPWFVGGGDYHIQAFSPAIDNASATYAPALDIDIQSRPQGAGDDIGADEYYP